MARLDIENLSFSVGTTDILKNVNLTVEEGRCMALLGPSGCGKTTTLRSVAGFVEPTAGSISLNGRPLQGLPVHKRNVGLVFQDYALFPHMSVMDNVEYGLRRRKVGASERKRRAGEALDLVQLGNLAERMPDQLSGGQKQRVALARALVLKPDILLLDEPLGALDRQLRDHMQVELKRIQRETNITTVIVTHDQEEALSLSDQIAVMVAGKIVEVGTPSRLYASPKSRAVMEFLGASNILDAVIEPFGMASSTVTIGGQHKLGIERSFSVSGKTRIGIRPEWIGISKGAPEDNGGEAADRLCGTVEEVVYKGPHEEIYVGVTGLPPILVQRRAGIGSSGDPFAIGDAVHLTVAADAILIFDKEEV